MDRARPGVGGIMAAAIGHAAVVRAVRTLEAVTDWGGSREDLDEAVF